MSEALGDKVANRYSLVEPLGQGGMATVYRAVDTRTGEALALKRLSLERDSGRRDRLLALFQREFYALAQLAHPSVIRVYDYGIDDVGPYYTMELLEGSDLQQLAPLPYRRVCSILYDVASALSILHSRRLVHRDVTSRNIFIVEGKAKLIDFGALLPMGPTEDIVGTPTYVAPEVVLAQPLDARTDLYSLGVVMYHALTGRLPYAVRQVSDLRAAWIREPVPPTEFVQCIPRELERLTLSLIALDRNARPRDAAEVMERLAGIADFERPTGAAARAQLVSPARVGREEEVDHASRVISRSLAGSGGALVITGPTGIGRSRMLDACVLEAKILGGIVLRARAAGPREPFSLVQGLVKQLVEALPDLVRNEQAVLPNHRRLFDERGERLLPLQSVRARRPEILNAVRRLLFEASRARGIVIAVDDFEDVDEASAATLARLLDGAPSRRLLVVAATNTDLVPDTVAHRTIVEHGERLELPPLGSPAIKDLFQSLFGKLNNLEAITAWAYRVSRGNPRDAVTLGEHLVDGGLLRYDAGVWVSTRELTQDILPASMSDALRDRIQRLPPLARRLAQSHALSAQDTLAFQDFLRLAEGEPPGEVLRALQMLVAADILDTDGHNYRLKHEGWLSPLTENLSAKETAESHAALARMLKTGEAEPLATSYHLLLAGEAQEALDILVQFVSGFGRQAVDVFDTTKLGGEQLGEMFELALSAHKQSGRRPLDVSLRYFMMAMGVFVDTSWFTKMAPEVLDLLKRGSGFVVWQTLEHIEDPMARILMSMQKAQEEHDRAPEEERAEPPGVAVPLLVQYAVAAIAIGTRTMDLDLVRSLPPLLEPFAPLSPIIDAMYRNTQGAVDMTYGRHEDARRRFKEVYDAIEAVEASALEHAEEIRDALAVGMAAAEMRLGISGATRWLDKLGDHPRYARTALDLKRTVALHEGNWAEAQRFADRADQCMLENNVKQIFGQSNISDELSAYALGSDLGAVKQLTSVIERLAKEHPNWLPVYHLARGYYFRLCEDLPAAQLAFAESLRLCEPDSRTECPDLTWYRAAEARLEILSERGFDTQALAEAERCLEWSNGKPTGARYHGVRRMLALSMAKLGDVQGARSVLQTLIRERLELGTSGIHLGLLYETSAKVALVSGDLDEFERFAHLTASEYFRCDESGFGVRYRRLLELARQHAPNVAASVAELRSVSEVATDVMTVFEPPSLITSMDMVARAEYALELLCRQAQATGGHVFLVRNDAPDLITSLGAEQVEPEIEPILRRLLEEEKHEVTSQAATLTSLLPKTPPIWTRMDGQCYRFIPMYAHRGNADVCVGVAALRYAHAEEPPASVSKLATMLARYLIDSEGVPMQSAAP